MKFLALNGSPHGAKGNTEQVLQAFLEGAREAGAETEVVYLKDKTIKHCLGCFTCWTKTPGVCVHKDDMPALLEKMRAADVMVYATPLYVFTMSGLMKDFVDRIIPLAQPYIIQRGEHYIHPPRYAPASDAAGKVVLISNSGYPEPLHFSGLVETFRRWADSPGEELVGAICCAGGALLQSEALRPSFAWYMDATKRAGREVVEQGRVSPETQKVLDQPLISNPAAYVDMVNAHWQSQGVELFDILGEFQPEARVPATAGVPLPPPQSMATMRDLVSGMAYSFNPQAAGDLEAVIQFQVTGAEAGRYYLDIAQGHCTAYAGEHPEPKLTLITPAEVWMAISRGEMNGATALMTGKYSVKGDIGLLMRLGQLFKKE